MITYEHRPGIDGGLYCPVVVCDACGQRITRSGNTYWVVLDDGQVHPGVWHTHKFPCSRLDDTIAADHPGGVVMSEELDRWLDQLAHNTKENAQP